MKMFNPPHPGEVLRELCLEPLELTVTEAADALGVSRKTLSALLNGRSGVSPEMAIRLSKAFGTSAESWLNQQMHYDLWVAEQTLGDINVRPSVGSVAMSEGKTSISQVSSYDHVLTIGTTGMLASATQALAEQSKALTCMARTDASLRRVEQRIGQSNGEFRPVPVNYHDEGLFMQALEEAWRYEPFELVVAWIHSSGNQSFKNMTEFLSQQSAETKLFHVVGSAAADPAQKAKEQAFGGGSLSYRQVILGFQVEVAGSRWLTDDEISQGTLQAIREEKAQYVIGTVEPWSARP